MVRFKSKYLLAFICALAIGKRSLCQIGVGDNLQTGNLSNPVVYSTEGVTAVSDTNHLFIIQDIIITGNERTKPAVILRELPFKQNEEYPLGTIIEKFRKAKRQLMNTGLFRNVVVSLKNGSDRNVFISVDVEEKWYLWPAVFLKPVDKSFCEWLSDKNKSMDRINYGLRISHNNISGNNDKLRLSVMNGYTRQISIQYFGLWLDKDMKWSTNSGVSYSQNREVNYMTAGNRQVPIKTNDGFLHSYVGGFFQVNYRPAIKTTHTFGIGYTYEQIADTVFKLNPSYSSSANYLQYPEAFYLLSYHDVDYIPYPTRGFFGEASLTKKGFGIKSAVNLWELSAKASQSWLLSNKFFFNLKGLGLIKLPFSQPYVAKRFIGFDGRYIQGYENYVVDGVAGGYAKATLSRPIFATHIHFPYPKIKSLSSIPIKVYAKTFVDAGYIYNTRTGENSLTNRFLYSGGVGLDLVTYNDFVIKIEWSFNRLGQNGVYLHQRDF